MISDQTRKPGIKSVNEWNRMPARNRKSMNLRKSPLYKVHSHHHREKTIDPPRQFNLIHRRHSPSIRTKRSTLTLPKTEDTGRYRLCRRSLPYETSVPSPVSSLDVKGTVRCDFCNPSISLKYVQSLIFLGLSWYST